MTRFLHKNQIVNGLFKRAFEYGYVKLKSIISLEQLGILQDYDDNLFHKATYENHAMHNLLPNPKSSGYNLRNLGTDI